jgi:hypothetical protein
MSRYRPWRRLLACVCPILGLIASGAAHAGDRIEASLNFNFYPYLSKAKDDTDFTLSTNVTLPAGLSYFSFVNVGGVFHGASKQFLVSEQNLRWRLSPRIPLDATVQALIVRGEGTDNWQVGPRWRLNDTPLVRAFFEAIHASYNVSLFMRFDSAEGSVRQISHVYQLQFPYLSDRLYLSGFFDHNLHRGDPGGRQQAVITETQLGVRLFGNLYGIAEYRRNDYRASNTDNLAVGLEFRGKW